MRWIYSDPNNFVEAGFREQTSKRIRQWWQEFQQKLDDLDALFRGKSEWDLAGWMQNHLQVIHPELMWEFGPAVRGPGHRLVITPEINTDLRPLTATILQQAPDVYGWEFYEYRLPESAEQVAATVEARCDMSTNGVTVNVAAGEANRIDLIYRWPDLPGDEEASFNAAFVATECLLGEERLDRWVGVIRVIDAAEPVESGQRFLSLERLEPTFDAVMDSIREQLPSEPYAATIDDCRWAVMTLEPQEAEDYADRYDLMTSVTCNPELIQATFAAGPFFSERYSRCNESFCFVKIDGAGDMKDMAFEDREDLEEAVRNALEAVDAGTIIAGGTGLRYTYLELALTNLSAGITAVRRALQEGHVPARSWIQFHDANWSAEWVGIYDASPEPPMNRDEE